MPEEKDDQPFPWDTTTRKYVLTSAELIATFGVDQGAISERVDKLSCIEGRLYSFETDEGRTLHQLEYFFGFADMDDSDPMASQSSHARIVITGTHSNGLKLEIRGNGYFGYDDRGKIEGHFETPPIIITEDGDLEPDDFEPHEDDTPRGLIRFPMPPNYQRATRRVNEWGDLD